MNDCCKGRKGDQGPIGPAGPTFTVNSYTVSTGVIPGATTKIVSAAAASTGTLKYWGHLSMTDTAKNTATISPTVNGTPDSAGVGKATLDTAATIAVNGSIAITAGQTFDIRITLNAYSGNATIDSGVIHWTIV